MKKDILREANYVYNFDRQMYFNRTARKAFSVPFIDDNPEEVLAQCIKEAETGSGWQFYSSSILPEGVKRELESVLG